MTNSEPFYKTSAIKVIQPLESFYLLKIPATKLVKIAFSDPFTEDGRERRGIQRSEVEERRRSIAEFIQSSEAAFPSSVILGANFLPSGLQYIAPDDENDKSWHIRDTEEEFTEITIPTSTQLATLIDGQHRVSGFSRLIDELAMLNYDIDIPCAVYFDLPMAQQAYLFATVNSTQRKVDRSLAFELFGFQIEETDSATWSPEKLAIYITRLLNNTENSPFYNHIPPPDQSENRLRGQKRLHALGVDWIVSTATVVDGILRLISKDPAHDRNRINKKAVNQRKRSLLLKDNSPLRQLYLNENDRLIYEIIFNFFSALDQLVWKRHNPDSYILKTVGIQASFGLLEILSSKIMAQKNRSLDFMIEMLQPLEHANFDDVYFQASGIGRNRILNVMLYTLGMMRKADMNPRSIGMFEEYLERQSSRSNSNLKSSEQ